MGRVNKKKYTQAVAASSGDEKNKSSSDDDFQSANGNDSIGSKKLRLENDEGESSGKKSQKGAGKNAKSVKDKKVAAAGEKSKNDNTDEKEQSDEESTTASKSSKKASKENDKNSKASNKSNSKNKKPAVQEDDPKSDEEEQEEEEYEVQSIVDVKVEGGKTFYLVRWKGYSADDDTWEPKESLGCLELIEKFEKKRAELSNGKSKKDTKKDVKSSRKSNEKGQKGGGSPAAVDPTKEWEVDKIIDFAREKDGLLYRIRWKGYSAKHDTWEPRENLFCDDLIEKFDKRMKELENVSFKELREEPKKTKRLVNETALRTSYHNPIGRSSKRSVTKKRVFYGENEE